MRDSLPSTTFQNPVYGRSFPDPFVLKFNGQYFAYCTGAASDGRCFGRLRSFDLVEWEELPGAMEPLGTGEPYYWAPEVTYYNGKFFLYYSVGNETLMTIRVAVSDSPDGIFTDAGKALTRQDFAIDPHIFRDDDGRWFTFYATDFLDYSYIGTGTVVDEMLDPFTLKGDPRPVTRAQFDWQVYDPARKEKGGVRWHTVEGPFVLKRKGIYYEMFSGGNWQNISYGVSFAVSKTLMGDREWSQYSDGTKIPPILRTVPGKVIGPGHNSVVRGPNGRELYCVYHRWENDLRVMAIDRMDFSGVGRLFIIGPSTLSQPTPYKPVSHADFSLFNSKRMDIVVPPNSFLCRFSFRILEKHQFGRLGIVFSAEDGPAGEFSLLLNPEIKTAQYSNGPDSRDLDLPADIDLSSIHEISIEIDGRYIKLWLDNGELSFISTLVSTVSCITFISEKCAAEFSVLSVTGGFEDLFEADDIEQRGWHVNDTERFTRKDGCLYATGDDIVNAQISRNIQLGRNEVCINLRFEKFAADVSSVGINLSKIFEIRPGKRVMAVGNDTFELPEGFSVDKYHQFRFVSENGQTVMYLDAVLIGMIENEYTDHLSIVIKKAEISFDMVRYTLI